MTELPIGRLRTENFVRRNWFATAEGGTGIEDVLHPGYWSFVAKQLSPYDKITVASDDNEWLLELLVIAVANTAARVVELSRHDISAPADSGEAVNSMEVIWRGPHSKFAVVRRDSRQVVRDGFRNRAEALAHMAMSDGVRI